MTFEVGEYRALELIGTGASAQVWRGIQRATGAEVALKIFAVGCIAQARREASLAAAVDHPHLVRVIDVVADEDRCALVTEYAGGGDLTALLEARGRLSPGETLTVLIPIAAALATAHERDIVHGDLSGGNVVFDVAGRPLLADLGAGRAAAEGGIGVSATAADAAPELARGATPDPAADMFSLGSLGLACLTGRHAWPADDLRDVLIQAAAGQWPDPGDDAGPPALIALIRTLLEHDPLRRPGAAALVMDLRAVGRPVPVDLGRRAGPPAAPEQHRDGMALVIGSPGQRSRHGAAESVPSEEPGIRSGRSADSQSGDQPSRGREAERTRQDPQHARPDPDRLRRAHAVTRARSDAVRRVESPVATSRWRRWRRWPQRTRTPGQVGPPGHSRRSGPTPTLRISLLVLSCVLVTAASAAAGLWWAGLGRSDPVAAAPLAAAPLSAAPLAAAPLSVPTSVAVRPTGGPQGSPLPARTSPAAASPSRGATRSRTADPSSTPALPPGVGPGSKTGTSTTSTPGSLPTTPPAVDWSATVRALDDARAKAFTTRNVKLLDRVYTSGSAAKNTDAGIIGQFISGGLWVSGAHHRVDAVRVVGTSPIRVEVRDALPSYAILDGAGKVIGRTVARSSAARVLVLTLTPAGYRISLIESL